MRRPLILITVLCLTLPQADAIAQTENRAETEHLVVEWVDGTSETEIAAARSEGEKFYAAVASLLGGVPDHKIVVMLRGPSEQPNGRREAPSVDALGRIQLFKFDPAGHSYFSALAHEMVHAFRFSRPDKDWFFEEGFAELIALRVDPSLAGFPWFDFPVDVVAGQWIVRGEDIPLALLQGRHAELNQPCRAQSYGLRSSFFDYLGRAYGDETLIAMASREKAGSAQDYEQFFKKPFDALETEWREALLASYRKIENADALAARYRQESPIQYAPVCKRGEQF